jgi:hypothetical protein
MWQLIDFPLQPPSAAWRPTVGRGWCGFTTGLLPGVPCGALVCPVVQERRAAHDPPGTYEGQTALHIAIVNRDFDMVKFMVQVGRTV